MQVEIVVLDICKTISMYVKTAISSTPGIETAKHICLPFQVSVELVQCHINFRSCIDRFRHLFEYYLTNRVLDACMTYNLLVQLINQSISEAWVQ